jgi:hypothetical protein
MTNTMIEDVVVSFAAAARRCRDGVLVMYKRVTDYMRSKP